MSTGTSGTERHGPAESTWQPGTELPEQTYQVRRDDLAAYAAASGDDNPIHLCDEAATAVGLPGVVAHGMLTMALGGRALVSWCGDPGRVREYGVRFTRPVAVPAGDGGVEVRVAGSVRERSDSTARIDLTVTCGGSPVLGQARAVVDVPPPSRDA